jgi:hypothetical protein
VATHPRVWTCLLAVGLLAAPLLARAESAALRSWSDQRPGGNRFRVLKEFGEKAVLDRETGLVWWRSPETEQTFPNGSPHFSATTLCVVSRVGGRMGWRLPSADELLTLATTDAPVGGVALPADHPFDVDPTVRFWTHTRVVDANGTVAYYMVQFQDDGQNNPTASPPFTAISIPSSDARIWCVRAPGGSGGTAGQ